MCNPKKLRSFYKRKSPPQAKNLRYRGSKFGFCGFLGGVVSLEKNYPRGAG